MSKKRSILLVLFVLYCLFILWMTVVREPHAHRIIRFELFWAIRGYLTGESWGKKETIYWIENFIFFIPFGFFHPCRMDLKRVAMTAFIFSIVIELSQYAFILGECELDDVLANTIGAVIGFGFCKLCVRWKKEWARKFL